MLSWRKQPGEPVEKDEILFEIETDKVTVEVPSPAAGVLLRIDVSQGVAKVEQPVAWIGQVDEAIPSAGSAPTNAAPAETDRSSKDFSVQAVQPRVSASPAARRRARELGVDLSRVCGSGPGGRITERDVEESGGPQ